MKPAAQTTLSKLTPYWPVALIGLFCGFGWMVQRHQSTVAKNRGLEELVTRFAQTTEDQAMVSFAAGDFLHAAALLAPVNASSSAAPSARLLQARTLECLGRFAEAAAVYARIDQEPSVKLAAVRGRKFAQRMASERKPSETGSREPLYRLHEELMQRGDAVTARMIARKLLPDTEPLRASTVALLKQLDRDAHIVNSAEKGRLDVTVRNLDSRVLELLHDLKIGTLSVARSGLDAPRVLAGLDVESLDLSCNGFADLHGLRTMPLRRLRLNDTRVVDLRALAGMPLRELSLSRTMISNVSPLSMCPIERLDLSSTAVRDLESLKGLELRELDLSNTRVSDLTPLSGMPLDRLVLSGTNVHNLKPLAGARLKALALAGTAVKDLSALKNMPLVELDLRGCELLTDVSALASCGQLERVLLPPHIEVPANHWGLPQVRIVQSERRLTVAQN